MAKNEKDSNKKQNGRYFKDMKAELKKVIWPAPKQLANNTITVIAFTLALALIVFVLDVCFDLINKNGVVALQEKITSSYNSTSSEDNSTSENTTDGNTTNENTTEGNATSNESSNTAEQNATGNNEDNSVKAEAKTEEKEASKNESNNSSENSVEANSTNTESKQ